MRFWMRMMIINSFLPAELMNIWLLVKVVAVLTDVIQLGVDGGIILAMAVFWHSSIALPAIIENL